MATDKIFHIVIIHVTFITECLCASEMLLMCYFNAKARYRHEMARIDTSSIDFSICTHYIYAYAFIVDHSQAVFPSDPAKELGNNGAYRDFTTRDVNSAASSKRLLSFGGLNESANTALNAMIMSNQYIQRFSNNAIAFLRQHHFSGLDIDWQFPVTPQMQSGLVTLLRTLREAIDRDTTGEKLLLTVKCPAVPQGHPYDVPAISRYADYVILAAYNITPPNASLTSFGSPLYGQEITVNSTVHEWLRQGLPVNKTVVGISAVGRLVELMNDSQYLPNSPITNRILPGYFYTIPGGMAYPEACRIKMGGHDFFDQNTMMHFTYIDINWLGYEDKRSVYEKIMWMKSLNIRGIMFSGVDEDDFSGTNCEDGRYPLLNFIKSNLTLPKQVLPKQTTTKRPPRKQQSTYTAFRRLEASSSTGPTSTQTTLQSSDPTTVHEVTNQKVYKKSFHNFYLILLIIFLFCLVVLLIAGVYMFK